jgi:cell division initiation protein
MFNNDDQTQTAESRRLPATDRGLTVSPLDLRQARFATAMRGFNRTEVAAFLREASEGYEHALRENERLRQEVARLEGSLGQYRDLEGSLKSTLMTAQKTADEVREHAQKAADEMRGSAAQDAARIVREAEGRAELLVQQAHARQEEIQRDIDNLRLKRREASANLESLIGALRSTIEFIREQEQRDQRVVPHRPRDLTTQPA